MKPVIIAVAITGSVPRKKDNPALPVTPSEQVESTHQAFEAGASLVHIHVRNPDETPSSDPALFAQVQEGVRKHCPGMIVQFSTGGRGRDPAARGNALELRPDMASLATGSVNFPTIVYENSAELSDKPLWPTPLEQERRATPLVRKARLKLAQRSRPSHPMSPPPDADRRRTAPSYYILTNLGQRDEPYAKRLLEDKLKIMLETESVSLVLTAITRLEDHQCSLLRPVGN